MMHTKTQMLSRRLFLTQCAAATVAPMAASQTSEPAIKLVREFKNAYLVAISPSGDRYCLYFSDRPVQTFPWPQAGTERGAGREELRVMDTASGKTVFNHQLRKQVYRGSFFREGDRLYVETLAFPEGNQMFSQRAVIDLASGKIDDNLRQDQPEGSSIFYTALSDATLLGTEIDGRSRRTRFLVRAKLPDYTEVSRVPYALATRQPSGNSTDLAFAADRRTVAYAVDGSILCRRTEDLEVIWTRPVEPALRAWRLAMTADASRLAVAFVDTALVEQQRKYSIGVYSGEDGSPVARLPVNGFEGLAISPDGKLLGVGQRIEAGTGEAQPTVQLYDIASGRRVGSVMHDRIRLERGRNLNGSFNNNGIQFTNDGKYLLTSGLNTKSWTID